MPRNNRNYVIFGIITILIIVVIAMTMKPRTDESTTLGRAAGEISEGVRDAADELNPRERTTGEKVGDAVEDLGNDIKDAARN